MKNIFIAATLFSVTIGFSQEHKTEKALEHKTIKKVNVDEKELRKEKEKQKHDIPNSGPISFESTTVERAEVKYDDQELFVFVFKNYSDTPLIIQNVQTSCGCTTAEKPTEPVQPGEMGKIAVHYDTKRVGDFHKTITVTTNVQTEPIVLTIKGKVLPNETPAVTPEQQIKN